MPCYCWKNFLFLSLLWCHNERAMYLLQLPFILLMLLLFFCARCVLYIYSNVCSERTQQQKKAHVQVPFFYHCSIWKCFTNFMTFNAPTNTKIMTLFAFFFPRLRVCLFFQLFLTFSHRAVENVGDFFFCLRGKLLTLENVFVIYNWLTDKWICWMWEGTCAFYIKEIFPLPFL